MISDKNRLPIVNPDISKEWHPVKNGKLTPYDVSFGSHKKVWWSGIKCSHQWLAAVNDRTNKKSGCPYCNGKLVDQGNCLATTNPLVTKEWHPIKNGTLTPYDITSNSQRKVWWKCKKGHEWKSQVSSVNNGHKCPYRSGHKVSDSNRLSACCPELIQEWDFDKNKKQPSEYSYGSRSKVWWKCKKRKHEWKSAIKTRASLKSGCPYCKGVVLKNGIHCDSIVEAFFYLKYKRNKIKFKHNKNYPKENGEKLGTYGLCRYDFYFPEEDKYIEITSYSKNEKWWYSYLRNIVKKKKYVQNVLGAKFELIQIKLTKKQINFVKRNSENYV